MFIILNEFGNDLFNSTCDDVVGDAVDRSIGVAVDADDDARILHTGDVLNLSGDTAGDVHLRVNGNTRLTNLTVVIQPACINSSTRTTNLT